MIVEAIEKEFNSPVGVKYFNYVVDEPIKSKITACIIKQKIFSSREHREYDYEVLINYEDFELERKEFPSYEKARNFLRDTEEQVIRIAEKIVHKIYDAERDIVATYRDLVYYGENNND